MLYWICCLVAATWPGEVSLAKEQVDYVRRIQAHEAFVMEFLPPEAAADRLRALRRTYRLPMFEKPLPPEPMPTKP